MGLEYGEVERYGRRGMMMKVMGHARGVAWHRRDNAEQQLVAMQRRVKDSVASLATDTIASRPINANRKTTGLYFLYFRGREVG